ncbi:MAG: hypothetical protein ACOH1N_10750 [Lutibacter sp.]
MNALKIKLENCYGIKSLEHTFDFTTKNVFSLYAANGVMKTSFAKTMKDYSTNKSTTDQIFTDRITVREIKDELDNVVESSQIFVIEPYIEKYKSERVSTLLVNQTLKDRYEEILKQIEQEKNILISKLKQLSGLTGRNNPIETELYNVFGKKSFFDILLELEELVEKRTTHPFSSITYNSIFEEKVLKFLTTKDFKKQIKEYIERYDTLIQSSKYLKKGFNHSNVSEIQKSLKSNGFFQAKHSVNLFNGKTNDIITDENELQDLITKEIETVLNDSEIQKKFNEIDSKLTNVQLKDFREYLFDNKEILPELVNLENFRKEIWYSYFVEQKELFNKLIEEYKKGKTEIEEIIIVAKGQSTDWKEVISIFNKRFSVPFELLMQNQDDVILKSETPNLSFAFTDHSVPETKNVDEQGLLSVLSQGERRALYLLNIIFEVRARKNANQETVFIIDDIADSFDYKNKYAIVEYLKEISEESNFKQIILTHNFDFHRTVCGRLDMNRNNKLNTIKTLTGIKIINEKYQNNPFLFWKDNLQTNNKMVVAAIPFVRNLAEYSGHNSDFIKLTSLLHYKEDTDTILISDLESIFKRILVDKTALSLTEPNKIVINLIFDIADSIQALTDEVIELESKIVLSIAIRLKAEIYMVNEINDELFWKGIMKMQSFELLKRYKNDFPNKSIHISLLEQINLMTPENIHLNSFMYEPILDMANEHLKLLYNEAKTVLI